MLDFRVVNLDLSISFGNINQTSPSGLLLTASLQHPVLPSANLGRSLGNAGQRTHCVSSPQLMDRAAAGRLRELGPRCPAAVFSRNGHRAGERSMDPGAGAGRGSCSAPYWLYGSKHIP